MKRAPAFLGLSLVAAVGSLAFNGCTPSVNTNGAPVSVAEAALKPAPPPAGVAAVPLEPLPLTPSATSFDTARFGSADAGSGVAVGTAPDGATPAPGQPSATSQPNTTAPASGGAKSGLFSGLFGKALGGATPATTPPSGTAPDDGSATKLPPGRAPNGAVPNGIGLPGTPPPGMHRPPGGPGPGVAPVRRPDLSGRPGNAPAGGGPANGAPGSVGGGNTGKPLIVTGSGKDLDKATTGVGAQGRDYGLGIITTPVASNFAAQQSIVFKIQIPSGMNTFKAYNNRYPKSAEEFSKEILEPANIALPELPAGEHYVYDPEKGDLLVAHPAKPQ